MPIDSVPPGVLLVDPWADKWFHATAENVKITWDASAFNRTVNVTVMSYREHDVIVGDPDWVVSIRSEQNCPLNGTR